MTTANNPNNNLSPWQPGQSGHPGGKPKALETYALARFIGDKTVTNESPHSKIWAFICGQQRVDDLSG